MRAPVLLMAAIVFSSTATAGGDAEPPNNDPVPLDRHGVIGLVLDKTVECRKEKDASLCSTYLSSQGRVARVMAEDGARREGVWFVDDQDRLCILWQGKLKPLCLSVYEQADGTHRLVKAGKHVSTLLSTAEGNPKGL